MLLYESMTSGVVSEYTPIDKSVYHFLKESTASFVADRALTFYHVSLTYAEVLEKTQEVCEALYAAGVRKGDRIVVSLPSIPEAVYLFYAINRLGAIYCGVDCRYKQRELEDIWASLSPKMAFVSDFHLPEFQFRVSCPIVYISADHSLGVSSAISSFFRNTFTGRFVAMSKISGLVSYKTFLSRRQPMADSDYPIVRGDDPAAYFYTSGTTYGRKCVILTNENINTSVYQQATVPNNYQRGDRYLNIMPPFTCYGITLGTHLPMCVGVEICLYPLFSAKKMMSILRKTKPNMIITVPSHWEYFIKDTTSTDSFAFLHIIIVGGDTLQPTYYEAIRSALQRHDCHAMLCNGYGLTETASSATVPIRQSPAQSIGIALPWMSVAIFEPETERPLPPNSVGEICISGPSVCRGYYGDSQATAALLHVHSDGKTWLHSGDLGYVDEQGNVFFQERIKRMYVRYDGTKVSPYAIEQVLLTCPLVGQCLVTAVPDPDHAHGMCAYTYVVLKDRQDTARAKQKIEQFIQSNVAEYMRPTGVEIVETLPTTAMGKRAYFSK